MIETWIPKWRAPNLVELDKTRAQKRKDDAKEHVTQLAERRRNKKVATEVRAVCEVAQAAVE